MATSIEERLKDLIRSRLAAITTGAGYEQTVAAVHAASSSPPPMEAPALPAVQLRHDGTQKVAHIRGAYECVADFTVICIAERDSQNEKIADLMADVEKLVLANKRWNDGADNLARRTWLGSPEFHETETDEETMTGHVPFSVLFRVSSTNPYALAEV